MKDILKFTYGEYVKMRFAELLSQGVGGENAYTIASAEYVKAFVDDAKAKKRAKQSKR